MTTSSSIDKHTSSVCTCGGTSCKKPKKIWMALFAVFYVVSVVPVGVVIYTTKSHAGFDVFKPGGVHAFAKCLESSFNPKKINISR